MVVVGIKNGKIPYPQSSQGTAKKYPTSFPMKKEGETSAVMIDLDNSYRPPANPHHSPMLQVPYQGQYYVAAAAPTKYQRPADQKPQYQQAHPNNWGQNPGHNQYRPLYQWMRIAQSPFHTVNASRSS